jgi:hypothetical protein
MHIVFFVKLQGNKGESITILNFVVSYPIFGVIIIWFTLINGRMELQLTKDLLTLDNIFIMGFCNCVGDSFIPLF